MSSSAWLISMDNKRISEADNPEKWFGFNCITLIRGKSVEQFVEADLLAVILFADLWFMVNPKGFRSSKKARQLAQAA